MLCSYVKKKKIFTEGQFPSHYKLGMLEIIIHITYCIYVYSVPSLAISALPTSWNR